MSYYMHHVPGRLRVKTPFIKGKEEQALQVQGLIESLPGVRSASGNTVTGSLVIHYDPRRIEPERIMDCLTREGIFDHSKALTNDQYIHSAASAAGHWVWKAAFGALADGLFSGSPLSLLTALL